LFGLAAIGVPEARNMKLETTLSPQSSVAFGNGFEGSGYSFWNSYVGELPQSPTPVGSPTSNRVSSVFEPVCTDSKAECG